MIQDFAGKTAFITGGASGLGLSMAKSFGRVGMNVMIADIDERTGAKALEELRSRQIKAEFTTCDVTERGAVEDAAKRTLDTFGKVHLVVNNAGVAAGGPIGTVPARDWDWIIDVNLKGVIYGVETFVPLVLSHGEGGHIVNTASMAGMVSPPMMEPYTATKFAVVAMSEGWAGQLGPQNIGVSVLCPGFVKTQIHESGRGRQERYGGVREPTPAEGGLDASSAVLAGIDPDIVGERVLEAVKAGEMWIFTHPTYRPYLEGRFAMIMAAMDKAAQSEALKAVKEWPPLIPPQ